MKNFSNTYIFTFSVIMVVLVAILLAFVSSQLKPLQTLNKEIERKGDILHSVGAAMDEVKGSEKNDYISAEFDKYISSSYVVDYNGKIVEDADAFEVTLKIKEQADKDVQDRLFPVFVYSSSTGDVKYIVPVRGKGLWGPIWGYMSFNPDMNTIYGVIFDHEGETPGLGAEINATWFEEEFKGKQIFSEDGKFVSVKVLKSVDTKGNPHAVDAISGGTITSKGLEDMVLDYMEGYVNHFQAKQVEN